MVVRAVGVIFLSVYLMAGNHLTVSAANGEKISEDSVSVFLARTWILF